jgi:hypothetical protein
MIYRKIEENCPNVKAICSVSSSFLSEALGANDGEVLRPRRRHPPFNPAHMVP